MNLPARQNVLSVRLRAEDNGKPLKITVGGIVLFEGRLLYTQGEAEYVREFLIPEESLEEVREKEAGGKTRCVLPVRFEGNGEEDSARVCSFVRIFAQ